MRVKAPKTKYPFYWLDRNENLLAIESMTDSHLENALRLTLRRSQRDCGPGEMAMLACLLDELLDRMATGRSVREPSPPPGLGNKILYQPVHEGQTYAKGSP